MVNEELYGGYLEENKESLLNEQAVAPAHSAKVTVVALTMAQIPALYDNFRAIILEQIHQIVLIDIDWMSPTSI